MFSDVRMGMAAILKAGVPIGCGMLVSPRHVLTCAHVVCQALDCDSQRPTAPTGRVRLRFPLLDRDEEKQIRVDAHVVGWSNGDNGPDASPGQDLALLALDGDPPDGCAPVRLRTGGGRPDLLFRAFGFPDGYPNGQWAKGMFRDEQALGWVQLDHDANSGYFVQPGFSGTPVVDVGADEVVGVVVGADSAAAAAPGFMIPARRIMRVARGWDATDELTPWWIVPHNLSREPKNIVGRETLIAEAGRRLRRHRLVTLTGPGGCGKSRLVREIAATLLDQYPDGAWIVSLDRTADELDIVQRIAAAFDIAESRNGSLRNRLLERIGTRAALLVLDDGDRLSAVGQELISRLLRACPQLRIVVTSRRPLGLKTDPVREVLWRIRPLDVPSERGRYDRKRYLESGALRLFLDRAGASLSPSSLTDDELKTVARICRQLDGMPLAIEMVVPRLQEKSIDALGQSLESELRKFYRDDPDAAPGQRTLTALFDWSYHELSLEQQRLIERLSVFAGRVECESVVDICSGQSGLTDAGGGSLSADAIPVLLQELFESSWLARDESGGAENDGEPNGSPVSFTLQNTIRLFAAEKLRQRGDEMHWRRRHCDWFVRLAERAEPELRGPDSMDWLERLDRERENLRDAIRWSVQHGASELGMRIVAALSRFWLNRGYLSEGREALSLVLARSPARARAALGAGRLAQGQGDYATARYLYDESLAICRALGDRAGVARALSGLGEAAYFRADRETARLLHQRSMRLGEEVDDRSIIATAHLNLGLLDRDDGKQLDALEHFEECLRLRRELGDRNAEANVLQHLGIVLHTNGELDHAIVRYQECLKLYRELVYRHGEATVLNNLGDIAQTRHQYDVALPLHLESQAIRQELGDRRGLSHTYHNLGVVSFGTGDLDEARRYFRQSLLLKEALNDRVGLATSFEHIGKLAVKDGHPADAATLIGAAEEIRSAVRQPLWHYDEADYFQYRAAIQEVLGKDAFQERLQAGQAMVQGTSGSINVTAPLALARALLDAL